MSKQALASQVDDIKLIDDLTHVLKDQNADPSNVARCLEYLATILGKLEAPAAKLQACKYLENEASTKSL